MFKCTECEKIYDIKPDYCDDCGSDTFIEIVEEKESPTPVIKQEIIKEEKIEPKKEDDIIIPNKKPSKEKVQIDYLSWGFLGVCILIALFIIFFAWNPKEIDVAKEKPEDNSSKNVSNIPSSVNGFWNNELPKVEPKKVVEAPVIQEAQPKQEPVLKEENKAPKVISNIIKTQETNKPKPISTAQKPTKTTQQKPQTVQKQANNQTTKSQTVQKTAKKPTSTVQKPAQIQPKQAQTQVQKPAQTTKPTQTAQTAQQVKQPQQTTQPVWQAMQQQTQTTQPTVDTAALKKELANYKVALRNTIGKKIDFANVIGDGSCTVAFKIASNGKLTNRAFSQQSTNSTLNDAVYAAVMATPSYNPPPSGYKNETLHLKITFYNGNFQISLN